MVEKRELNNQNKLSRKSSILNKPYYAINLSLIDRIKTDLETKRCWVVTAILIYFYRINRYQSLDVRLAYALSNQLESQPEKLLTASFSPDSSWAEALTLIKAATLNLQVKPSLLETPGQFPHSASDHELKIKIEITESREDFINYPQDLDFHFVLTNRKLYLKKCKISSSVPCKNVLPHVLKILSNGLKNPHAPIYCVEFITSVEKNLLLKTWNDTQWPASLDSNLSALFEAHARSTPGKIAVCYQGNRITYDELNQLANKVANYLKQKGVEEKDFVAIFFDRSINMLAAILAILKVGAAYVPIDVNYPLARIKYIIDDSKCKLILSQTHLISQHLIELQEIISNRLIGLDAEMGGILAQSAELLVKPAIESRYLAYLIYTSGSTGAPKGVLITHRNVINYATWFAEIFKLKPHSVVDFSSSIGFDLSVSCTLVPLIMGARVAICQQGNKLVPLSYLQHLQEQRVSHIECTPDYFNHLLAFPEEIKKLNKLKWIMLGGDALVKKDLETWLALQPKHKLPNEYGPTECTVAVTAQIITKNNVQSYGYNVPIGKPGFNNQAYILDPYFNLCPVGAPGELCFAGESVAFGYMNQGQTTAAFVQNPFPESGLSSRLYKTGDLARWLPDGTIEFLGRIDEQVKIRGFRIELSEIENCLRQNTKISQCKATAQKDEDGERFLICYIVLHEETDCSSSELKQYLRKFLPKYMVPKQIIFLEELPTNNSGKIDLKALAQCKPELSSFTECLVAQDNSIEAQLLSIWRHLFRSKHVALDDDFFELGGYSLLAFKMVQRIEKTCNVKLPLPVLFKNPTINKLGVAINYLQQIQPQQGIQNPATIAPRILCLQPKGKKTPIFLFHPVGGAVFIFRKFAAYLGTDRPIYAFQDPGIEMPEVNFTDLQQMALCYLRGLKTVQPNGPYIFAGASFGATLAVELAHQLNFLGEQVPFLGLLDGWSTYSDELTDKDYFQELMSGRLSELPPAAKQSLLDMQFSREQLLFSYKIPPITEKLTLFKAKELWPIFEKVDSPYNGWDRQVKNSIELYLIPGDHETMFAEPHVKMLANKFRGCMRHLKI